MGPTKPKPRLNIHIRRPGTLQALKMLTVRESGEKDQAVRITDLVNEALEIFVRERIDVRIAKGLDPESFWEFLDMVDLTVPGDPDYPDEATVDQILKEGKTSE